MFATPPAIFGAVEGLVDEAVLTRLVGDAGALLSVVYGKEGKGALRKSIRGYNSAARRFPWVVLIDLDHDAECAPVAVADWLPAPAPFMRLRVAVREVEAWLLADRERMASFLKVPLELMPQDPDGLADPKLRVVDLARRSRRKDIRVDLVPRDESGRKEGPAYGSRLIEFAGQMWRPDRAAERSDSLRRCRKRIAELVAGR
jgi:hypothetical protein